MICERNIKNEDWKSCKKVSTIEKTDKIVQKNLKISEFMLFFVKNIQK